MRTTMSLTSKLERARAETRIEHPQHTHLLDQEPLGSAALSMILTDQGRLTGGTKAGEMLVRLASVMTAREMSSGEVKKYYVELISLYAEEFDRAGPETPTRQAHGEAIDKAIDALSTHFGELKAAQRTKTDRPALNDASTVAGRLAQMMFR